MRLAFILLALLLHRSQSRLAEQCHASDDHDRANYEARWGEQSAVSFFFLINSLQTSYDTLDWLGWKKHRLRYTRIHFKIFAHARK